MDNNIIQAFKNEIVVETVLQKLLLDYDIRGENAVISCPFHSEGTPSMFIKLDTGCYHCFGCDTKGGDVVKFVMELKTLGFVQALELLSELCEIQLPKDVEEIDKFKLIQRKLIFMKQDYQAESIKLDYTPVYRYLLDLCSVNVAVTYLEKRGIVNAKDVVEKVNVRVLEHYDEVNKKMLEHFSARKLIDSGVMNDRQNVIFYNHRLLLPFFQEENIVYLTGRALSNDIKPKYLNLADITIPDMYNVNDTNSQIVYLCEGQTDTLSLIGLGLPAVGIAGATNINFRSLEALQDKTVVLCFDNDKAGQDGQRKLVEVLKYIADKVIVYEKDQKDMNDNLQTEENRQKLLDFHKGILCNQNS